MEKRISGIQYKNKAWGLKTKKGEKKKKKQKQKQKQKSNLWNSGKRHFVVLTKQLCQALLATLIVFRLFTHLSCGIAAARASLPLRFSSSAFL